MLSTKSSTPRGGVPLVQLLGKPLPPARFVSIAIGLSAAVEREHRAGKLSGALRPQLFVVDEDAARASLLVAPDPDDPPLAYLSPEAAGRAGRPPDQRSDLYSLGVVLYELLVGQLPFEVTDPLELLHCHVARVPTPPHQVVPGTPRMLSEIVVRLLAKPPEDRYQSAIGLRMDLERCRDGADAGGQIGAFVLGTHDQPRLRPARLHGRRAELALLRRTVDRLFEDGATQFIAIGGATGSGKTALVSGLREFIVGRGARYGVGKFEERGMPAPYLTLRTAVGGIVEELAVDESAGSESRARLVQHLGPSAAVVAEIVPSIEKLLGPQPPLDNVTDVQRRSWLVSAFGRFVAALASRNNPLVVFLDDVQWADPETRTLLSHVLADPESSHVLWILAYRDDEPGAAGAIELIEGARSSDRSIEAISLGPLDGDAMAKLTADVLGRAQKDVVDLGRHVAAQSGGNPFVGLQVLEALRTDGVLSFDYLARQWRCHSEMLPSGPPSPVDPNDPSAVHLSHLPKGTARLLGLAACAGWTTDVELLTLVGGVDEEEVRIRLEPAVRLGVLGGMDPVVFAHDNLRRASWAMLNETERVQARLQIGRALLARTEASELQTQVFAIINHLGAEPALLRDDAERRTLAELYLIAGRGARTVGALSTATMHIDAGLALLPEDAWDSNRDLKFGMSLERARLAYAQREIELGTGLVTELIAHAASPPELGAAYRLAFDLDIDRGAPAEAVEVGLEALRALGLEVKRRPSPDELVSAREGVRAALGDRTIESLSEQETMTDPASLAAINVLPSMTSVAFFSDEIELWEALHSVGTDLMVRNGFAPESPLVFVGFGGLLVARLDEGEEGLRWGRLGLELTERPIGAPVRGRAKMTFSVLILPAARPYAEAVAGYREGVRLVIETADHLFAGQSDLLIALMAASGRPLGEVGREIDDLLRLERRFGSKDLTARLGAYKQIVDFLTGASGAQPVEVVEPAPTRFSSSEILTTMLVAREIMDDADGATATLGLLEPLPSAFSLFFSAPVYHCCAALIRARAHDFAERSERDELRAAVDTHVGHLDRWARRCPQNFASLSHLAHAERARIADDELGALHFYDDAIRSAKESGLLQWEARAAELAARFHEAHDRTAAERGYVRAAFDTYLRWGAHAKIAQLEARYPGLAPQGPTIHGAHIDRMAVAAASQAISGSLFLDELMDKMMRIVLAQAAAERGSLVLVDNGRAEVRAEATVRGDEVAVRLYEEDRGPGIGVLPRSMLDAARDKMEPVTVSEGYAAAGIRDDPYLIQARPQWAACVPLSRQARLVGFVYVESRTVGLPFDADRIAVLGVLAGQIAVSLENARLFEQLRKENADRSRAERAHKASEERFRQLAESITEAFWLSETGSGRVLYVSPGYEAIWGRSAEELYDDPAAWLDAVHSDDRDNAPPRQGEASWSYDSEFRIVRPDGTIRWVQARTFPVRTPWGHIYRIAGVAEDITERKTAEKERARVENELRVLLDQLPVGVLLRDATGKYVRINDRGCEILGLPREQFLGFTSEDLFELLHITTVDQVPLTPEQAPSALSLQELSDASAETFITRPDGRLRRLWTKATPIVLAEGEAPAALVVIGDVTEQRAVEEQLVQAQKLEAVGRLAGGVAHDFNNLLSVIMNSAFFLNDSVSESEQRQDAQEIIAASRRAADLVRQLLTFSRGDYPHPHVLDVNDVVRDMANMLERIIGEDIEVETDLAANLWRTKMDRTLLEQILANLAVNARDAMSIGDRLTIATSNARIDQHGWSGTSLSPGDYVCITVSDTGTGMDETTRQRIFEPFFTTKEEGTGLGLATVYGIVRNASGDIAVTSEIGSGTEFRIYLPSTMEDIAEEAGAADVAEGGHGERVLLVEDEEAVRRLIDRMLTEHGFSVTSVSSGPEAVIAAADEPFDLLLTDVVMPVMSGPDLADRLEEDARVRAVLFMSAYPDASITRTVLPEDCLNKPFTAHTLLTAVHRAIAKGKSG